jgi:hypothetical protein
VHQRRPRGDCRDRQKLVRARPQRRHVESVARLRGLAEQSGPGADDGVDVAETALSIAREKAAGRGLDAGFIACDGLRLERLGRAFDTVLDCGLFHSFDTDERRGYAASMASVTSARMACRAGRRGPSDLARSPALVGSMTTA